MADINARRRLLKKKKSIKAKPAGKPKSAAKNLGSKRGQHSSNVSWQTKKELDPASTEFPLSHWGASVKGARNENYLFTLRLAYDQACNTDGSGNIATVFSAAVAGAQNWTNYAAVFDEYRVLAQKVTFEPFWTVNTTFAPFASVIDRSDATALTSYGLAERYASHKKKMGKSSWRQSVSMSSPEEAGFSATTASTTTFWWIKTYSSGNTASQTIGRYNVEFIVQFRGVGIN